jgi:hypothetical protein
MGGDPRRYRARCRIVRPKLTPAVVARGDSDEKYARLATISLPRNDEAGVLRFAFATAGGGAPEEPDATDNDAAFAIARRSFWDSDQTVAQSAAHQSTTQRIVVARTTWPPLSGAAAARAG